MNPDTSRPKVAVIGCGGTISSIGASLTDLMDYPERGSKMSIEEMLGRLPEAARIAELVAVPFRSVGSTDLTYADWLDLGETLRRFAREQPDLAGFVIAHGTATLEETAFFLDLTLDIEQTVVLVGAQRPFSALSSDAPMNLYGAVRVAGAAASRGRGVLVALNDGIFAARDVVKTSTLRLETFRSGDHGALGVIDPDGIHYYRRSERRHAPHGRFIAPPAELARVDIVYSYVGADETFIEAAINKGARGLVSAGLAPGIPTKAERKALEAAIAAGIAVVQCSRAAGGRVARRAYLEENGFIGGEDFGPQKARILLALGLSRNSDVNELRKLFEEH